MTPSRICVAWQKRSSPPPSSGRMKPNPLWFHAIQTPVLRGPPSPPNSPLLGAPPASRAPGLRERRGGERERGRGSSLRGGLRSAINADSPIDVRKHEPVVVREDGVANRFDLLPTSDPLGRKWQLQASNAQEASEWRTA